MAQASRARVRAAQRAAGARAARAGGRALPPPPPLRLDPRGFDLIAEAETALAGAGQLRAAGEDVSAARDAPMRAAARRRSRCSPSPRASTARSRIWRAPPSALAPHAVPAMRKDFLVDPYQVLEARARRCRRGARHPAHARRGSEIESLLDCAREHGLFVLLEAFDAAGHRAACTSWCRRCGAAAQLLAGVNCRDLRTLRSCPSGCSSSRRCCRRRCRAWPRAAWPPADDARGGRGRLRARTRRQRADARRQIPRHGWRSCSRRGARRAERA